MNAVLKVRPTISKERFSDALCEELSPLLYSHWQEIANYKKEIPLDVDFDFYRNMDAKGQLLILTARSEGELVGYSIFFLIRNPHYNSTLQAMNDVIYVDPPFRNSRLGLDLIRQSEQHLKGMGVRKMSWHVKTCNDVEQVLHRLGYQVEEISMGKLL